MVISSCWINPFIIMWCPPLPLVTSFVLKSILSDTSNATHAFFSLFIAWNIIFHPFTFSLFMSLGLKWVSCRQHVDVSCFFIHSVTLCLLIGAFSPFTFRVIIDRYALIVIAGFRFIVTKGSRLTPLLSKSLT